jgi:beta-galactosidase
MQKERLVSSMRDQLDLLIRAATRVAVGAACAAALSCGGDNAGTANVDPTQIVVQPQNQTVAAGSPATFSVQFAGAPPVSFNWIKGGDLIPGATALTYTTPPTVSSDDGLTYGVRVATAVGGGRAIPILLYSTMATLTVVPAVPAVAGIFNAVGSMVTPRAGHTATLMPNGKVLIVGGQQSDGPPTAAVGTSAELYDPATATFTATGSMIGTRLNGHTATLLSDGK